MLYIYICDILEGGQFFVYYFFNVLFIVLAV